MYIPAIHIYLSILIGYTDIGMSQPLTIIVKVVRIGNSLRMTIPRSVARVLELKEGDALEVGISNDVIIAKKAETSREPTKSERGSTPLSEMPDLSELAALRERLLRIERTLSNQKKTRTREV